MEKTANYKEILMNLRHEVIRGLNDNAQAARDMAQGDVPDIGDMSSATYDRDVLLNLSEVQRRKIRDIDAALERLEQGEYGVCLGCGEDIPEKRMQVRPFSRYCVECKTDVERFGE